MFLYSQLDSMVGFISILAVLAIVVGGLLKKMEQPYIIGYILIGMLMSDQCLGLVSNGEWIHSLGEIGIILLLFFIGMEINLTDFVKQWKLAVIGTLIQIITSVCVVFGIGYFLEWRMERSLVLGFVIALSSSAIVIKILQDKGLIETEMGKNVLSVLLAQDVLIVPLLIIITLVGGASTPVSTLILMFVGGLLMVGTLAYIYKKEKITIPFSKTIEKDHELQVFLAILFCFGGALISLVFGLSPGLGAFVGGIAMHAANSTDWIHQTLHAFRVLFVSFFFISVGLQIDFNFIAANWGTIASVLLAVYVINHAINMLMLRWFSSSWGEAFLGGAFLAQIGEMSFLLSFSAYQLNIIETYGYNFTISLISLTLIISPFWISLSQKIVATRTSKKLV